jgi:hypothetical protein
MDYHPYLYKTEDYGRTWQALAAGFPAGEISRVIREDPVRPGLLYVGTETGIVVSRDDGRTWHRGGAGTCRSLPSTTSRSRAATSWRRHTGGRSGSWTTSRPLRESVEEAAGAPHLFPPRPTVRPWQNWSVDLFRGPGKAHKNYMMALGTGLTFYEDRTPEANAIRTFLDAGENPPVGAIVYYSVGTGVRRAREPDIPRRGGSVIRNLHDAARDPRRPQRPAPRGHARRAAPRTGAAAATRYVTARPGLNRFVWDLRYPAPRKSGRRLDREGDHGSARAARPLPGPPDGGRPLVDPAVRGAGKILA